MNAYRVLFVKTTESKSLNLWNKQAKLLSVAHIFSYLLLHSHSNINPDCRTSITNHQMSLSINSIFPATWKRNLLVLTQEVNAVTFSGFNILTTTNHISPGGRVRLFPYPSTNHISPGGGGFSFSSSATRNILVRTRKLPLCARLYSYVLVFHVFCYSYVLVAKGVMLAPEASEILQ